MQRLLRRPKVLILTPVLMALAFIIACGGAAATSVPEVKVKAPTPTLFIKVVEQPSPSPLPVAGATAAATPVPEPTATTAPATQVKYGGIIPMQGYAAPVTARPLLEATYSHLQVIGPLYNQLVEYNPETDDTDDSRCDLCTNWELSADGLSYVYHLVEIGRWSDGVLITSADIVFTFESIVDPDQFGDLWEGHKTRSRSGMFKPYFESIWAIDEYTVEMKLKYPAAAWHAAVALEPVKMMPKHAVLAGKLQGYAKADDMVTSGPFKPVKFIKDVSIEQTKNEDYFKEGRPYIDGIIHYIIVDVGTIIAAFASEQVLMTNGNVDNIGSVESKQFLEDYGDRYNVYFVGPAGKYNVMMNTEKKPFDDPRVRLAMGMAINRQQVMDTFGVGDLQTGLPFPPGTWYGRTLEEAEQVPGFRLLNGEKHPDDIAEAKRLLTEAGFPDGFDSEIVLRRAGLYPDIGTVMAEQFKKYLNVNLEIRIMESAAGQAAYLAGDYNIAIQGQSLPFLDPDAAFVEFKTGGLLGETWARSANTVNWDKLNDPFDRQSRETDPEKRKALIREAADSLIFEDNAIPGIYYSTSTMNFHKKIQNFHPHPSLYAAGQKWEHIWCDPAC